MRKKTQPLGKYALAALAAVAALFLRRLLDPLFGGENLYHTAWVAVVFSVWYCGVGPAILALLISLFGIWGWFLSPHHWFRIPRSPEFFGMLGFVALSAVIIALGDSVRRTIAKLQGVEDELRESQGELEKRVRERTEALEQKTGELAEQAQMLDLANDAIFVRSVNDIVSYWNEGAQRLYGWTKEEILGRSPHELLRTEFPIPIEQIKARETWEGELRHNKRDGSRIIVASRWRTLRDPDGKVIGWLEINTDITSRKRAEAAARSLSGRILTLQDGERRRIARGLHDSLGQYLAALKMNLDLLPVTTAEQAKVASDCSEIVSKCLAETRTISHLLHPPLLDEAGLASAARWFVDEFSRRSGIAVTFEVSPELVRLSSELEIALFRAIQEGLTNVHRHSGASTVDIRLEVADKHVRLTIHDNGRGIAPEEMTRLAEGGAQMGVGLAGMRERLRQLSGSLEIQSDASGTTIVVVTPAPSNPSLEPHLVA